MNISSTEFGTVDFLGACLFDNKLWFVHTFYNALFYLDLDKYSVNYVGSIPTENVNSIYLCSNIVNVGDKLVLVPDGMKNIVVYNIKQGNFENYELEYDDLSLDDYNKFLCAFVYKGYVYMVGANWPILIKFDAANGHKEIFNVFSNIPFSKKGLFALENYVLHKNILYLPIYQTNKLLKLNLDTMEWDFISIGEEDNVFTGICSNGEKIWLCQIKNSLIEWDVANGNIREIELSAEASSFRSCHCINDNIWLIPLQGRYIVKRLPNEDMEYYELPDDAVIEWSWKSYSSVCFRKVVDNKIIFLNESDRQLYVIEDLRQTFNLAPVEYHIQWDYDSFEQFELSINMSRGMNVLTENSQELNLKNFLDALCKMVNKVK